MKLLKFTLAILALFSLTANSIVMRHDKRPELYQVKQSDYPSVVNLKYMTGTLISPQWVMTAGHGVHVLPANYKIEINGNDYYVESIIPHPSYNQKSQDNQNHDIALLKLTKPVDGIEPTGIYTLKDEVLKHVWFVGSGYVGNGEVGITGPSTSMNHAENIIDSVDDLWINFDFDSPQNNALKIEGISGPGDSGGPAFIQTAQGLKVAGVSSHQMNDDDTPEGLYGVGEQYTRVSQYGDWINSVLNKSHTELKKVASERTVYKKEKASEQEKSSLLGSYLLEDASELILKPCDNDICYSFAGRPGQSKIYKAQNNFWFTPNLNRAFKVVETKNSKITQILIKDFMGERTATKKL
jgi:secreted trypsin-like serine protease